MLGDSRLTERPDATSAADKAVAGQQVASARGVWLSGQVYLMFVWLLGVIVLTTWLVMKVRQLKARRSKSPDTAALPSLIGSLLSDTARKLNLRRVPDVVFSEGVVSPAVFGTLRAYPNNQ
jgi:beta-lactamase regulating signal transducer with metallopeptidase domain